MTVIRARRRRNGQSPVRTSGSAWFVVDRLGGPWDGRLYDLITVFAAWSATNRSDHRPWSAGRNWPETGRVCPVSTHAHGQPSAWSGFWRTASARRIDPILDGVDVAVWKTLWLLSATQIYLANSWVVDCSLSFSPCFFTLLSARNPACFRIAPLRITRSFFSSSLRQLLLLLLLAIAISTASYIAVQAPAPRKTATPLAASSYTAASKNSNRTHTTT